MEAVRNAGEGGEVNVDIIIAPSNVPGTIKKKAPSTIRKSVKTTAKSKQTTASKSKKVVKKKKIVESSDEDEAENDMDDWTSNHEDVQEVVAKSTTSRRKPLVDAN